MSQSMRSELGRVRGLGSAHHGIQHWWLQRLSAIALVPLTIWFLYSVLNTTPETAAHFIAQPLNALLAALLVVCTFQHMQLGLQVVIEDYVHDTAWKFFGLIAVKFLSFGIAAACLLSIILIAVR